MYSTTITPISHISIHTHFKKLLSNYSIVLNTKGKNLSNKPQSVRNDKNKNLPSTSLEFASVSDHIKRRVVWLRKRIFLYFFMKEIPDSG